MSDAARKPAPVLGRDPADEQAPSIGYWRRVWQRFRGNRRGVAGLIIVLSLCGVAYFSPLLANDQPIVCRYDGKLVFPALVELTWFDLGPIKFHLIEKPWPFNRPDTNAKQMLAESFALWPIVPFAPEEVNVAIMLQPPSRDHWLGTDEVGRDLLARMIYGTIVSVKVGFISMGIASVIGIFLGAAAGYFGGWIDIVISRVIEIVICFPVFFLILSIMVWLEPNIVNVMVVIGLTRWTSIARYTRGEFIRLKTQDYVIAATALGASSMRIMFRHVLPNALAPVLVTVTFGIANAILVEAGLSWLGFGVQPPDPSWGNILRTAYENVRNYPHLVWPPCVAIFMAVLAYNLVGDALRAAIDPRIHAR